jgi:hypothetical protein
MPRLPSKQHSNSYLPHADKRSWHDVIGALTLWYVSWHVACRCGEGLGMIGVRGFTDLHVLLGSKICTHERPLFYFLARPILCQKLCTLAAR